MAERDVDELIRAFARIVAGERLCENAQEYLGRFEPAADSQAAGGRQNPAARFVGDGASPSPAGIRAPKDSPTTGLGSTSQPEARYPEL